MLRGISVGEMRSGAIVDSNGKSLGVIAQLSRTSSSLELQIKWFKDDSNDPLLSAWFESGGRVPDSIYFADENGVLTILKHTDIKLSSGYVNDHKIITVIIHSKVCVSSESPFDYSLIHGLKSTLNGAYDWFDNGIFDFADEKFDHNDNLRRVDVPKPKIIRLGSFDGISVVLKSCTVSSFRQGGEGRLMKLSENVEIVTKSNRLMDWNDHLSLHQDIQDLFSLGLKKRVDLTDQNVLRRRHRSMYDLSGDNWRDVVISLPESLSIPNIMPHTYALIRDSNIGPSGLKSWLNMRRRYARAIDPFLLIHSGEVNSVRSACFEMGVALESLGYDLMQEAGWSKRQAKGASLRRRLRHICESSPTITNFLDVDRWSGSMANSYNSLKHSHKQGELVPLSNIQEDVHIALTVMTIWIVERLGINPEDTKSFFDYRLSRYKGREVPPETGGILDDADYHI